MSATRDDGLLARSARPRRRSTARGASRDRDAATRWPGRARYSRWDGTPAGRRPRRRRDHRRARRRRHGRGRPRRGAAPAHGARLARPATRRGRTCAGLRDLMDRLRAAARGGSWSGTSSATCSATSGSELDEIVAAGASGRRAAARPTASADGTERRRPARDAPRRRREAARPARRRCPRDVGERIRGLQDYDFLEPDARERFDDAGRTGSAGQMLDQYVAGLSDAIRSMRPEDLAANREMVRDLNELLRERIGGEPTRTSREFLAKHGRFFPGAQTLDDIIDQLAERMAAMQSLLRSMTPEQRAELQSMMDALLRDDRLLAGTSPSSPRTSTCCCPAASASGCRSAATSRSASRRRSTRSNGSQAIDRLEDALVRRRGPGRPRRHRPRRGPRPARATMAVRDLDALDDLARRLERGRLPRRATASGSSSRRAAVGGSARRSSTTCSRGSGATRSAVTASDRAGRGGEREETTKPYEFGDPFHLDLRAHADATRCAREENAPAARLARDDRAIRLDRRRLRGVPDRAARRGPRRSCSST